MRQDIDTLATMDIEQLALEQAAEQDFRNTEAEAIREDAAMAALENDWERGFDFFDEDPVGYFQV